MQAPLSINRVALALKLSRAIPYFAGQSVRQLLMGGRRLRKRFFVASLNFSVGAEKSPAVEVRGRGESRRTVPWGEETHIPTAYGPGGVLEHALEKLRRGVWHGNPRSS